MSNKRLPFIIDRSENEDERSESLQLDKVTVMKDIDELHDTYCGDCLVIKQLRKDRGKTKAHRFCITSCTVGEQLQFLGEELMKVYKA